MENKISFDSWMKAYAIKSGEIIDKYQTIADLIKDYKYFLKYNK